MKKKTKYEETCEEIKAKIKATEKNNGKHAISSSNTDLINMAQNLMNSPEYEVDNYNIRASEDGRPITATEKPAERFRNSLKPILRTMGIDKEEINKLDEYQFNKEQAASVMNLAGTVIKDYIQLGRKYKFPVTGQEEAQMSFYCDRTDTKKTKIKKFDKDVDGTIRPIDTGKIRITKAHDSLKVTNSIPHWLKEDK